MTRAVWLVDIGYVVKAAGGKFKLDYVDAEAFLVETLGPTQTFLFNGFDPAYGIPDGLEGFYHAMRQRGMRVRLHPMQSGPPGTNRQRRVDVDLSAHLVWQACRPEIDVLVLTTGDQDFVPAVEIARQELGKRVLLFTYAAYVNHDLIVAADDWWTFEQHERRVARP
jgi:uncharacterized LabA/DUF88 family protein